MYVGGQHICNVNVTSINLRRNNVEVKTSNLGRYAKDESYYTNINFYLNSNVQHASSVSDWICDRTTLSV